MIKRGAAQQPTTMESANFSWCQTQLLNEPGFKPFVQPQSCLSNSLGFVNLLRREFGSGGVVSLLPTVTILCRHSHEVPAASRRHYRDAILSHFFCLIYNFSVRQLCQYNQSLKLIRIALYKLIKINYYFMN